MALESSLEIVRSAVRATAVDSHSSVPRESGTLSGRVVTLSRQAGIDVTSLARRLAASLDEHFGRDDPWIIYDRELVQRVAGDHDISHDLVASLDEHDKSWFEHVTAGLTGVGTGHDVALKTSQTIRGIARIGHAIIVGRGGQLILANLPGAAHVRLIAPLAWRVERHARRCGLVSSDAERIVREMDSQRERFIQRHFNRNLGDDTLYDLVINVARVETARAADLCGRLLFGGG